MAIDKPSDYFNTKLYTGTGSSQNITGVGFQPDLLWLKSRSNADFHYFQDVVRGVTKQLATNTTGAETSYTNGVTAFGTDGFTVDSSNWSNRSGGTFVGWNWKANGTGVANTDGSISSTVSANTTSGFSIVSYTGTGANATVGHGLGVAPKMIIVKKYNVTGSWGVYHNSLGNGNFLYLNDTNASASNSTLWNNTSPTSSVFNLGSSAISNSSSNSHIAYCFAEKQGFSKFGSYTGNGSTNGTFVYLGFKPAFVLLKHSSGGTDNWNLYDNKRLGYNANYSFLIPNESNAENTGTTTAPLDLLSNGFKIRASTGHSNSSGETYIYMAFAENPFVTSTGVPATAR
mgnify:CR=1 FL=1